MRFDIDTQGRTTNIRAKICTASILEAAAVNSVQKWLYNPKIFNGQPVMRPDVEAAIRFDLADERGNVLPLPEGYSLSTSQ